MGISSSDKPDLIIFQFTAAHFLQPTYQNPLNPYCTTTMSEEPTMRAIRVHTFGGPEVLNFEDTVAIPQLKDNQVMIIRTCIIFRTSAQDYLECLLEEFRHTSTTMIVFASSQMLCIYGFEEKYPYVRAGHSNPCVYKTS